MSSNKEKTMKFIIVSLGLLSLTFISGCQNKYNNQGLSEDFGNAVYQNEAVHILPPKHASNKNTPHQGDRGALAFERYKTGTTIAPSTSSTSSLSGSGGGDSE